MHTIWIGANREGVTFTLNFHTRRHFYPPEGESKGRHRMFLTYANGETLESLLLNERVIQCVAHILTGGPFLGELQIQDPVTEKVLAAHSYDEDKLKRLDL